MHLLLKLTVSLGLVIGLLFTTNVTEVANTIQGSDYRYFALATAASLAGMCLAARRWQILLGRYEAGHGFRVLFRLIGLSYFYNFFVPGGIAGDLIRGFSCGTQRLSGIQGVASVVVDRIIGLGSFVMLGLAGCVFSADALAAVPAGSWLWVGLAGLTFGACIGGGRIMGGALRVLSKLSPVAGDQMNLLVDSICAYRRSGSLAGRAMAISLLTAMINIGSFCLLGRAAGSDVGLIQFVLYVPVITVVSYLPISYSGLGIRELCFMALFPQVGMTAGQALAVPLLYFGMMMILSLTGGLVYWVPRLAGAFGDVPSAGSSGCPAASATRSTGASDDAKRTHDFGSPS